MKQTAMQELIEDLQETISVATEALSKIENEAIKTACQEAFTLTLKKIIKRIDEELLEKEKLQQDEFAIEFTEWLCDYEITKEQIKTRLETFKL